MRRLRTGSHLEPAMPRPVFDRLTALGGRRLGASTSAEYALSLRSEETWNGLPRHRRCHTRSSSLSRWE